MTSFRFLILGCLLGMNLFCPMAKAEVKDHMDEMLVQIFSLKPFIISPTEFAQPQNDVVIDTALKNMVTISKSINHEDKIKNTSFQIPASLLQQQIKETEIIFRTGNKDYALWLLRSTLSNCMACHTQLPAVSTRFESMNKDHFLANPFDEAEFLYIVRNFNKAIEFYSKAIAGFPDNKIISNNIEIAIYRKVYYYVRVQRDFKDLENSLSEDLKNKKLTPYLRNMLTEYKKASHELASEKFPDYSSSQESLLQKNAESILKNEMNGQFATDDAKKNLINLRLSSTLYQFLKNNPNTKLKPQIYYWLSFCENRWQGFSFDSLPQLYLKKCIMEFPQDPVAPRCFKEYQDLITIAYTGSAGTQIPGDVQRELKTLQDLIEKMQPKK